MTDVDRDPILCKRRTIDMPPGGERESKIFYDILRCVSSM